MIAYYLHHLSPFIWEIRPGLGPRWYGLAYVLAFVAGYALYRWLAERGYSELPPEKVDGFITGVAIFGVMLGGRVGHFVFYAWDDFVSNPLSFFKLWEGGMSSHGGMLGIIFFTLYYSRRHKLSWTGLGDNLVVVAPIGLFFGRIANFINGELIGRVCSSALPWAAQFPSELKNAPSAAQVHADPELQQRLREILSPRHPSQIYEALLEGVVLFGVLWFLRTKTRQPRGVLTGAFFIVYALARILCECFREPEDPLIGAFTRGQFLSLFLILIGVAFVIYGLRTRQFERENLSAKNAK